MLVRVREDIRHGDYRSVRVCDVVATREKVLLFLQGSPYATAATAAGNPFVERVVDGILAGERVGLGWAWYDVLPLGGEWVAPVIVDGVFMDPTVWDVIEPPF